MRLGKSSVEDRPHKKGGCGIETRSAAYLIPSLNKTFCVCLSLSLSLSRTEERDGDVIYGEGRG